MLFIFLFWLLFRFLLVTLLLLLPLLLPVILPEEEVAFRLVPPIFCPLFELTEELLLLTLLPEEFVLTDSRLEELPEDEDEEEYSDLLPALLPEDEFLVEE